MGRLTGKVVMITGTSRGLGLGLAEAFRAEGAEVERASRREGIDVTQEEDVITWFDRAQEIHGRIDVLVNNAGVLTPRKPLAEVAIEEWEESIAGNLTSVFLCCREAVRRMIPQESGLIINVSSGVADRAAPLWGAYAAAKWGALGLTKLLAEEVGGEGIRVVAVNPSRTRTTMRAEAYPDEDPLTVKTPEKTAPFFLALAAGEIPFENGEHLEWREV